MAPEIQGHQGYGELAPHNSLAAFRKAAADPNVKSVEFDVFSTKDRFLVITHENAESQTLQEVQAVDIGDGERVPLFLDVIDVCLAGGLFMNVEIKRGGGDVETTLRTVALLRTRNALGHCCISSFGRAILRVVAEACPEVPIGCLYHESTGYKDPADPSKGIIFEDEPADFLSWMDVPARRSVEGDSVNFRAEALLLKPDLVRQARAAGKKVMAWFPFTTNPGYEDSFSVYKRIVDLGVDVVCCNRSDILVEVLKSAKPGAAPAGAKGASAKAKAATRGKPSAKVVKSKAKAKGPDPAVLKKPAAKRAKKA